MQKQKKMQVHLQKDSWSCGVCAWASVLRMSKDQLLKYIPPAIVEFNAYVEELEGYYTQGLPMELFLDVAQKKNKIVAIYILHTIPYPKIKKLLLGREGVIVQKKPNDGYHAVAWDGETVHDSDRGVMRDLKNVFEEGIDQFYEVRTL